LTEAEISELFNEGNGERVPCKESGLYFSSSEGNEFDCDESKEGVMRYNVKHKIMEYCNGNDWRPTFAPVNDGKSEYRAGKSCKSILDDGYSVGDGVYWIDPGGYGGIDAFQVYCDMTTDGGGWTLYAAINDGASISINANTFNNGYSTPDLNNINNGNWVYDVEKFNSNVSVMRLNMGDVKDFYKPLENHSFKQMITSNDKHLWSKNLTDFIQPQYYSTHLGGSATDWPNNNVENDNRRYLSFWGGGTGGCCNVSYQTNEGPWKQPFMLWIR